MNDIKKLRSKRAYAIVDQIKPNLVGRDSYASDESDKEEVLPAKVNNQQDQELEVVQKKLASKKRRLDDYPVLQGLHQLCQKMLLMQRRRNLLIML